MAAVGVSGQQGPDRESPAESADAPAPSTLTNKDNPEEQNSSNKDGDVTSPSVQVSVTANSGQPNAYPQTHAIYYGGYDNSRAPWDEYSQFLYSEGMEPGPHGTHPLIFHAGYGYSPQMTFGPYSPVATLPLVRRENHMYSSQEPHLSGPYFHQPGPNTMAYYNSHSPPSPANSTSSFGPGPSLFSNGQYFHDTWQSSDGFGPGGLWSDWLKSPDSLRPLTPLSPVASPHPFGPGFSPFSSTMGYRRQRTDIAVNTVSSSICSCDGPIDILNEQNRGPRASAVEVKPTAACIDFGSYNKFDFKTDYDDARFFVIKSYSEDNVHKSIKYGVWASTPNGNRKLDAAYSESKDKGTDCPIFLLFSVNASAHFCGVAEMVGPVDFEKSVDYWQQDKWTGHFPVKWHVVKDVPNSLFRHIILENNDNKPVTNSRDTQEVKLEQGVEMLNIFKKHESLMSILDDFEFYEEREKMMEERKAHQRKHEQVQLTVMSVGQLQKSFAEAVRLDEKKSKRKEEAVTAEAGVGAAAAEYFPNRVAATSMKGG